MKKWEYKVERKGNEDRLNALGEDRMKTGPRIV